MDSGGSENQQEMYFNILKLQRGMEKTKGTTQISLELTKEGV